MATKTYIKEVCFLQFFLAHAEFPTSSGCGVKVDGGGQRQRNTLETSDNPTCLWGGVGRRRTTTGPLLDRWSANNPSWMGKHIDRIGRARN
jgi:hypothetical protein